MQETNNPELFQIKDNILMKVLDPTVKEVVIPQGVTEIGEDAFAQCLALTTLTCPDSLLKIRDRALKNCSALQSVLLPESLQEIGIQSFENCRSIQTLTLPMGLQKIGLWAFRHCDTLTEITLPPCATDLAYGIFMHCTALTSVTLPDTLTDMPCDFFFHCSALTKIDFPPSLREMGSSVFCHCISLTEINFSDSLTHIGESAFSRCESLTEIHLPDSLTHIEKEAFSDCTALTEIHLPNSLLYIGEKAFSYCTSLQEVTLPHSLEKIDSRAFQESTALKYIRGGNKEMEIGKDIFDIFTKFEFIPVYLLKKTHILLQAGYCIHSFDQLPKEEQDALFPMILENKELQHWIFKGQNATLTHRLLETLDPLDPLHLYYVKLYLDISIKHQSTAITALFLAYKNQHYTPDQWESYEAHLRAVALCEELPIFQEFQHKWFASLEEGTVCISGYQGTGVVEIIPKVLADGAVVTSFQWHDLVEPRENETLVEVVVESDLESIDLRALPSQLRILDFLGTVEGNIDYRPLLCLERLTLPSNTLVIETGTFSPHEALMALYLPDSLTEIQEGAFPTHEGFVVYGKSGSYGESYCLAHGFDFSVVRA